MYYQLGLFGFCHGFYLSLGFVLLVMGQWGVWTGVEGTGVLISFCLRCGYLLVTFGTHIWWIWFCHIGSPAFAIPSGQDLGFGSGSYSSTRGLSRERMYPV